MSDLKLEISKDERLLTTDRIERWRGNQITDEQAKLSIFNAFIEDELDAPKHLAKEVWNNWRNPAHEEFQPRTAYSLQNAYTSSFKLLDPVTEYRATASLGKFFTQ